MGAAEWSVISIWKDTPKVIYKAGREEKNTTTTTKAKKNIHHIFVSSGVKKKKTLDGLFFLSTLSISKELRAYIGTSIHAGSAHFLSFASKQISDNCFSKRYFCLHNSRDLSGREGDRSNLNSHTFQQTGKQGSEQETSERKRESEP